MPERIMPSERVSMLLSIFLHRSTIRQTRLSGVRLRRIPLASVLRDHMVPESAELLAGPFDVRARGIERRAEVERLAFALRDGVQYAVAEVDGSGVLEAVVDEEVDFRSCESRCSEASDKDERREGKHYATLSMRAALLHSFE